MNWRDLYSTINNWPEKFLPFSVEVHWHGGQRFSAVLEQRNEHLCLQLHRELNRGNWSELRENLIIRMLNWSADLSQPVVARLPQELHDQHEYHVELVRYHLEIENFHHHDYEVGGEGG